METDSAANRYARIALTVVEHIGLVIISIATIVAGYPELPGSGNYGRE
ncbi:MAG TPA: hypothetical protein PLZ79_04735 [Burkholderiales bacterium]|nr:hypothetical protein [Burkholderiales bacterium]